LTRERSVIDIILLTNPLARLQLLGKVDRDFEERAAEPILMRINAGDAEHQKFNFQESTELHIPLNAAQFPESLAFREALEQNPFIGIVNNPCIASAICEWQGPVFRMAEKRSRSNEYKIPIALTGSSG
jgi:hypothetical protein